MELPVLSVALITYERTDYLLRCLASLGPEQPDLADIVVVDASRRSAESRLGGVGLPLTYVHAPELAGWMTRSRNRALLHVRGDAVAFLDDDVVVRPGWAAAVRHAFASTGADAVSGRTCNGVPGEESYPLPIGRLLPDGRLTDGFAAATEGIQRVDHGIGANMSFTKAILHDLGGFRDDYPGTALREDTDMFLRVRRVGGKAVFAPDAVVDHLPAPHVRGQRFGTRYKLYGRRNHMVLLAREAGAASPMMRRWVVGQFADITEPRGLRRQLERSVVVVVGIIFGLGALAKERRWEAAEPRRQGRAAEQVRTALSRSS